MPPACTYDSSFFRIYLRPFFLGACGILLSLAAAAQPVLELQVRGGDGLPLASVNARLHYCNKPAPLQFAISNSAGLLRLQLPAATDSLCISLTHIQHAPVTITVQQAQANPRMQLQPRVLEIKEVVVTPPPVIRKGDTLVFQVSAFDQASFSSIGDVIKTLPGIEVAPNGTIAYNGRPIAAYYIEGLDLLGNRYRLANERLPKGMVNQVQIILHHQPIRMLDTLVRTNDVAINLQLHKSARGKLIHNLETRSGGSPREALLDANLQQIFISKQFQLLANINGNNTGLNNVDVLNGVSVKDYTELPIQFYKQNLVQTVTPTTPPLPATQFHFNQSFFPSVNLLKKIGTAAELKWNVNWVQQQIRQWQQQETRFAFADTLITVQENNRLQLREQVVQSGLQFTHNSKKFYQIADLRFTGYLQHQQQVVNTGTLPNTQIAALPEWDVAARTKILKTKGAWIWGTGALVQLRQSDQVLQVQPPAFADVFFPQLAAQLLQQPVNWRQAATRAYLSVARKLGTHHLTVKTEGAFTQDVLERRLLAQMPDGSSAGSSSFVPASVQSNEWRLRLLTQFARSWERSGYTLKLPLDFVFVNQTAAFNRVAFHNILPNATLSGYFNFSKTRTVSLAAERRNEVHSFLQRLPFGYLYNYRSFQTGTTAVLPFATGNSISLRVQEDNAVKRFLWNTSYTMEQLLSNTISDVVFEQQLLQAVLLPLQHREQRHSLAANGTLRFIEQRTIIKGGVQARLATYNQLQEKEVRRFRVHTYSLNAGAETRFIKNSMQEVTYTLQHTQTGITGAAMQAAGWQHHIKFENTMFLRKNKWSINTVHHLYLLQARSQNARLGQHHATIGYQLKKQRLELGLQNITNERYYYQFFAFSNVEAWSRFELRPFQALLRYRWELK
ncbi:MAG: hypothetical protein ACK4E8_12455 [Lacibacter sp.]